MADDIGVVQLLDAVQKQVNLFMSAATAGIGAIFFTWLKLLGLEEATSVFKHLKWPSFLALPLLCFILALASGYSVYSAFNGFLEEHVLRIGDYKLNESAAEFYKRAYKTPVIIFNFITIMLVFMGVTFMGAWYALNVFVLNYGRPSKGEGQ